MALGEGRVSRGRVRLSLKMSSGFWFFGFWFFFFSGLVGLDCGLAGQVGLFVFSDSAV